MAGKLSRVSTDRVGRRAIALSSGRLVWSFPPWRRGGRRLGADGRTRSDRFPLGFGNQNEPVRSRRLGRLGGIKEDGKNPRTGNHRPDRPYDAPKRKVGSVGGDGLTSENRTINQQRAPDDEQGEGPFEVSPIQLQCCLDTKTQGVGSSAAATGTRSPGRSPDSVASNVRCTIERNRRCSRPTWGLFSLPHG